MVMRVGGLASGMNIDEIVMKMMTTHKAPVTKMSQQLQQLEWKRQDLRDINRQVLDFRNKTFDFMLSTNFKQKIAQVSGNTSAVTASIKGDVIDGPISVSITQMATASNWQTNELTGLKGNSKLSDHNISGDVMIDGIKIEITDEMTMNQFIAEVNKKTSVSAFFDENSGRIGFQSKTTGAMSNPFTGSLFEAGGKFEIGSEEIGQNAIVKINGMEVTQASNTFEVNGVSFTIHQSSGDATINVKTDTDKVVDSIKSYIESYNSLLATLHGKLNEDRHRSFLPLTDEQRKQFKDEGHDIDEWTNKAKSGLLRNDTTLSRLLSDVRLAMSSTLETSAGISSLADLGITQERYSKGSDKNGALVIADEAKLREAIENNVDDVINLFNQRGNGDNNLSDVGLGERLYKSLKVALDDLTYKAGNPNAKDEVTSSLSKQIVNLGLSIDQQNQRMLKIENNLYKQFATMEAAMSRYASQSAYLMNAFGGQ